MVPEISEQILDGETYRVSIEKRNSYLSSQEIITKIENMLSTIKTSQKHANSSIFVYVSLDFYNILLCENLFKK